MTNYKIKDTETIKALERMSEEDPGGFSSDVLALINRQQLEIARLNEELQAAKVAANPFFMRYADPPIPMMSIKEIQKENEENNCAYH